MTAGLLSETMDIFFAENVYYNRPLFETDNFKVIPTLGSLVPGWLMIVPKKFHISYGAINLTEISDEFNSLLQKLDVVIMNEYGDYVMFEHGPVVRKSSVGCTVDYAHLHIVPIKINLVEQSKIYLDKEITWVKVNNIQETSKYYKRQVPYLYVRDLNKNEFIGITEEIPSQLFRRIIAKHIGLEDLYDWKKHSFINNIKKTIVNLEKYQETTVQL
jgi:ATP adenylyltransferase